MNAPSPITAREQCCAMLASGKMLRGNAILLLEGDGENRVLTAGELFRQKAAPEILISGGRNHPPECIPAHQLNIMLMARCGIAQEKILLDSASMNTQENAVACVDYAMEKDWKRLLIVTSAYHQYRAFLTFVAELRRRQQHEVIEILLFPCGELPWLQSPPGVEQTRLALLGGEFAKCETYHAAGHCASWEEGLEYLAFWEGK